MNYDEVLKLENQVCFSLYAASKGVIKKYKPILGRYNLTYTQYITMLVLWEHKKLSVKEIGDKLYLDSGTLTPVIKKLEGMNLVKKYRSDEDDRIVLVELTEEGVNLKEKVKDIPREIYCSTGMEVNELMELKGILDNLIQKSLEIEKEK
ncbi:MarR family transcriptional regulator [uncultured Clostridium sp.]|uniref:MarR family winged helix-turn-helix transcriptional regulator n=1 Tax=uncultured Clostridium sp. TaxID=59620 RepID=UPI002613351A|nr:MarR family transcriptional regulator [uncultured Clostridium sp.]